MSTTRRTRQERVDVLTTLRNEIGDLAAEVAAQSEALTALVADVVDGAMLKAETLRGTLRAVVLATDELEGAAADLADVADENNRLAREILAARAQASDTGWLLAYKAPRGATADELRVYAETGDNRWHVQPYLGDRRLKVRADYDLARALRDACGFMSSMPAPSCDEMAARIVGELLNAA